MEIITESVMEQSDDENEMNLVNTTRGRKKAKILDSDSENEDGAVSNELSVPQLSGAETENITLDKRPQKISIIDNSDSDDDDSKRHNKDNLIRKKKCCDAEDVMDEEDVTPHNKSFPDEETALEAIYTTSKMGELIKEGTHKVSSTLYDSESEDETNVSSYGEIIQPQVYKKQRKKSTKQPKKMTVQEAAKQRTEIQSESQRMLRESNVSLPYHKPKSYTIQEFLQKRSKLASAVPVIPKASPSVAIKMSKDQLQAVSKKLDERIKEVEEFYKSESEEDEDNDDPSEEIKGWLNLLVDNVMDMADAKMGEVAVVELEKDTEDTINEETQVQHEPESMDYEFNLDDSTENESTKKSTAAESIKDKLNIQPKLLGTSDDIIDLEEGVTRASAVKKLVDKFFKRNVKKVPHKHKVHVDVVSVGSHGEINRETVSMNVEEEEEPVLVETPGAKLQKLREELQQQMAQKRLEQWKQKHEQGDYIVPEKKTENEDCEAEKDILDDEDEEFEMTESESESEEDEEEYEVPPEKPRTKSAFINNEADEDEEEDCDDEFDGVDNENDKNDSCDADTEEVTDTIEAKSPKNRVLKRILKPFCIDSDDEEDCQSPVTEPAKVLKYYIDEDDIIPPNLPKVVKTPQRTQPEKAKSEFDFLTPVTYLTGLQNLNSDSKLKESLISPLHVPPVSSASQESDSQSKVQKNLFHEYLEPESTQDSIEDLAQLCSGNFPETQIRETEEKSLESEVAEDLPSTQDLLNLCSGDFLTGATKQVQPTLENTVIHFQTNRDKEIKNLDEEQDQIISQLLDEDELERFKKKFASPINPTIRKTQSLEDAEEVNATGLINSDDENEGLELTKKKRKKLVFSDDEDGASLDDSDDDSEEEDEKPEEEQIDLHATDEEEQLENEIVAQESYNYKTSDFLDEEAELSESDWGSADEDEKGLDELEMEQGDQETFNENKIRSELERIHMRQVLDEDNREVKLLQELLLEDGELHGTGRKRQFRWRTLDSENNGEFEKRDDDDVFLDEEENEEQWRKMRHKREMFLKKKSGTDDEDSILSDSQILKIGQQIFKNKSFSSQNNTPPNTSEDVCKESFNLLNKRGSFLSRNDQVLQRLAEYNKITTTVGSTAKNSKSFVFQSVASESIVKSYNNKRKATVGTPNIIKKLRLDDLSPAVGKMSLKKSTKAKKLFGNW